RRPTSTAVSPFFLLLAYGSHLHLHSFPTRRSSDLEPARTQPQQRFRHLADSALHPVLCLHKLHPAAVAGVDGQHRSAASERHLLRAEDAADHGSLTWYLC